MPMFIDPVRDLSSSASASLFLLAAGHGFDQAAFSRAKFVIAIGGTILGLLAVLLVGFTAFAALV